MKLFLTTIFIYLSLSNIYSNEFNHVSLNLTNNIDIKNMNFISYINYKYLGNIGIAFVIIGGITIFNGIICGLLEATILGSDRFVYENDKLERIGPQFDTMTIMLGWTTIGLLSGGLILFIPGLVMMIIGYKNIYNLSPGLSKKGWKYKLSLNVDGFSIKL